MPKFYYALFALFLCSFSYAQTFNFKGKVLDEKTNLPIESATVYLSNVKDSTVIDYTITDKFGKFNFKIKKLDKPVYLKVSFVTYTDYKEELKAIEADKDFGTIILKEAVNNLNEVVVKGQAPPIRIKKDTLEFNVSSFKVRPDANVETLLKQLPGVEIDADGKITVNGKEVNQILVNGKPFFDKDGKVALQNLPSDIINKVQVTDTKTKKEEKTGAAASSNSASINLTIDEKKNKGFFGKFMAGKGSDKRYESSTLLNYFKNKTKVSVLASSNNINSIGFSMDEVFDNMGGGRNSNIWMQDNGTFSINGRRYGSGSGITKSNMVGINYSDEWTKNTETSLSYFYSDANTKNTNRTSLINFLPSGNFTTNSNSSSIENRFTHNASSVFEFKIDSTMSIVLEPNFTKSNTKNGNLSSQSSFDATNALLNESTADNSSENESNNFTNTLSFTKSFKKKGKYVSLVFENENGTTTDKNYVKSKTIFYQGSIPDDDRNQFNNSKNLSANYRTEFEFTQPITDSLQVKLGLEYKHNKNNNNRNSFDFDATTQEYSSVNNLLTNEFNSVERTFAPNTGLVFTRNKFNIDLNMGTTIINFNNDATYLNVNSGLNKNYVIPSLRAYGGYRFSKSKNIWFNYNYNYDLPSAKQLLPMEDLANPLNTYVGNPNLDLNKYHNFYFSYRNFDYATRSGYGTYMGGNFYNNQVVSSVSYDANRKRTTTYDNVAGTYTSWFGVYWNKSFKKDANKYRFELRANNNFGLSKGFTDNQLYSAKTYSFSPRASFSYDYGELLTINPSYNYSYNTTSYTNYVVDKASNFTHKFNLQVTSYWPKNWTFGNDFGYNYNSNIADGFKKDFYLWNTSLSYSFFEKKLMAKVKVYDLLNQNQSATRTISATSIRDEENTVLKRYVMFSLTYKIEKFAGKEKKSGNRFMW
ncbi:outer membrane beta-barrel protein [Flavobacterium sp. SUN052]|uniref:outer membrane beta-barrel protein n=1 Tax=Flavobacterium sp. SUN052 TaxID=3002441 RepID=UPI00237E22C5|nr:outer membrane beta-barrel protein [Flavobacterium sp. SUN052]MEC4004715.1 outer membrane beta-barrel protein [Flavobacterium sp. SUN052]